MFLNGNRLKTLATMPVLEHLEVLVASNCFLSNLKMPVRARPPILLRTISAAVFVDAWCSCRSNLF